MSHRSSPARLAARLPAGRRSGALALGLALAAAVGPAFAPPAAARSLRDAGPSSLLAPGETEVRLWESFYTQTEFFDDDGDRRDAGGRASWHTATLAITRGWRAGLEPGLELGLRSVDDESFPAGARRRTAITTITPSVQWAPFPTRPEVSLRTGVVVPTGDDLDGSDGRPFLDFGDWTLLQQVFADVVLSERVQAYLETGGRLRFDRSQDDVQLTTPAKAVLNWHGSDRWTIYAAGDFAPDWIGDARGNFYSQAGLGAKLRPTETLELEVLATIFPFGKNAGAGSTLNAGLRWVR